jgi:N-acetylmuramoyl-L-alanine amidase
MPLEIIQSPSPNFNDRLRPVRFVVLHYTGMASADAALRVLSDPGPVREAYLGDIPANPTAPDAVLTQADALQPPAPPPPPPPPMNRVSSHYLIYEDGRTFQLVDESKRAWHAGRGSWDGETDLNSCSVGIEIANGGHDFGLPPYPEAQLASVFELVAQIVKRHGLDRHHVIGHSDLAPDRKPDPGEHFPWKRLAEAGLSIWPKPGPEDGDRRVLVEAEGTLDTAVSVFQLALATIGYGVTVNGAFDRFTRLCTIAFQRRFRPEQVDGKLDVETLALAGRVAAILRPA